MVDLEGEPVPPGQGGYLVVKHPWPGMMRTVYGNPDRFRRSYWEHIPPRDGHYVYFAGDGARRDSDGYFWVMGRVDDVINVAGHRLGTMEIESAWCRILRLLKRLWWGGLMQSRVRILWPLSAWKTPILPVMTSKRP